MTVKAAMLGERFGRLVVIAEVQGRPGSRGARWVCRCDCGTTKEVARVQLRQGETKSCGCLRRDSARRHGGYGTRTFGIYLGVKGRCFNPKRGDYPTYGGAGITMCPEWRESFQAFLRDMGPCPDGYSLDRIDNDGNYEPGNCRWVTPKRQAYNRGTTIKFVSLSGEHMCFADVVKHLAAGRWWLRRRFVSAGVIRDGSAASALGRLLGARLTAGKGERGADDI